MSERSRDRDGGVEEANLKVVRDGYDQFTKGNLEGTLRHFAQDAKLHLASATTTHQEHFRMLEEVETIEHFRPSEFLAQGDKVVVMGTYRAKVKATGQVYDDPWVEVLTVRNGKITEVHEFHDTAAQGIARGELRRV
jgi:uncharacterized protein